MNRYLILWTTSYGEERESNILARSAQDAVDQLRNGWGLPGTVTYVFLLTDMQGNWK